MPDVFIDQFWLIDPSNPPPVGTVLNVLKLQIIDQNDNGLINQFSDDSIDGVDIGLSYPGDTVTVELAGGETVTITGTTFYLDDGRVVFTPSDGSVLTTATLVSTTFVTSQGSVPVDDFGPACFVAGTLIDTPDGKKPVETLRKGDMVSGRQGHPVVIRNALRRSFNTRELLANPKLYPVRITAGALGNGLPERDLLVSRQHRMLIVSKIAERMFGEREVLVSAIKLTSIPSIFVDKNVKSVEYVHLLLDDHEILHAEGAPSESLFIGPQTINTLTEEAREEILSIFPMLGQEGFIQMPARKIPTGRKQKELVERHQKNKKNLLHSFRSSGQNDLHPEIGQ